jgi:methylase of polypeptide subunit release factors
MAEAGGRRSDELLLELLRNLELFGYRFVTPTPETHRRFLAREPGRRASGLRDIFGWSLPFAREAIPERLFELLSGASMVEEEAGLFRSRIRVSSLEGRLFLHSAYPTDRQDAVFFGPDSYRFVRFVLDELGRVADVRRLVDIGAGAGAGAIAAAARIGDARLTLTDTNPLALRFARINALNAGIAVEVLQGSGLDPVSGDFDLAIANPPFILDPARRIYRHGGGAHGAGLSLAWAGAAARRIAPGGRILLYSGSAIVAGEDRLEVALRESISAHQCSLRYQELDPDIFGEQLGEPGYEEVERIAAVGAVIEKAA